MVAEEEGALVLKEEGTLVRLVEEDLPLRARSSEDRGRTVNHWRWKKMVMVSMGVGVRRLELEVGDWRREASELPCRR